MLTVSHVSFLCVIAMHMQRLSVQNQLQSPPQVSASPSPTAAWLNPAITTQGLQSLQVSQQKLRLHSLQLERERLKLRQQEIIRQVSSTIIIQFNYYK